MDETYWVQAWPALVCTPSFAIANANRHVQTASKRMVAEGVKGKIVFVSSVLGYFSIVGYSTYSPGKFAVRGLAEALQSEFLLYGIGVHICFPGTIFTPGYEEENKVKPQVTLKIEESDSGSQPEVVAAHLLKGASAVLLPSFRGNNGMTQVSRRVTSTSHTISSATPSELRREARRRATVASCRKYTTSSARYAFAFGRDASSPHMPLLRLLFHSGVATLIKKS